MHWIAPSEKDAGNETLEKRLWAAAEQAVPVPHVAAEVGPGRRYPFGLPRTDNANYLWIQLFYSALRNPDKESGRGGRAGFVMANSAADARSSEQEIRKQLTQAPGTLAGAGPAE